MTTLTPRHPGATLVDYFLPNIYLIAIKANQKHEVPQMSL